MTTAAALATAIVADKDPEGADTGGVVLHALLAAAVGLSSCLKDKGKLTIHKVEYRAGHGLPVGDQVKLLIDYSVDVVVRPINVGVLSVQMQDAQPMRVRNRNVGLRINLSNPAASGVQTVELDFSRADMEIEDPGSWLVNSPASLFDILGTRSGRGSTWLEVDLRFKLNLGPVQVSGATIRATLEDNGSVSASLRGLDASLTVAGVIEGKGGLELLDEGGFTAALDVKLVPLNLAIDAVVLYQEKEHSFWLFVQMGVDFPGPIPIANTGLGIYGISGAFGLNAHPKPPGPAETDPIGYQLRWDSSDPVHAFEFSADNITVGAQAVFGTVPDLRILVLESRRVVRHRTRHRGPRLHLGQRARPAHGCHRSSAGRRRSGPRVPGRGGHRSGRRRHHRPQGPVDRSRPAQSGRAARCALPHQQR